MFYRFLHDISFKLFYWEFYLEIFETKTKHYEILNLSVNEKLIILGYFRCYISKVLKH